MSPIATSQIHDAAVPIVVVSSARDPMEALNSLLRKAGIPAHCTWIPALQDLPDALEQLNPEMLLSLMGSTEELTMVAKMRDQMAADVPLLVIRENLEEKTIADDMLLGARDSVSFAHPVRLQAVVERELGVFRMRRALHGTLSSAQDYRKQLEGVLRRSNDAIAQVQEGILVEANASWLELWGYVDSSAVVGQPVMDLFDEATHPALKGALIACLQCRWSDHTLKVEATLADNSTVPLELVLAQGHFDGDPCVRLIVPAQKHDERQLATALADAVRRDPRSGLLYRRALMEALIQRLAIPVQGGVRYFAFIRADEFERIERELGVLASEDFLAEFAGYLVAQLHPNDLLGHFGGHGYLALLERGTERDVEAWSDQLLQNIRKNTFAIGDKSIRATATIGLGVVPHGSANFEDAIADAMEASRQARERGGNQVGSIDKADADTRVQSYDLVWVKHIKSALMENRFRLVQQPIASLGGNDTQMFDVLVRMIDTQAKEVLPSEFMPAAERNDLLKNIDRWVIGASLAFAARRKPGCLFVRLSKDSAIDPSLAMWLDSQLKATQVEPQRICFQVTEDIASRYVQEIRRIANSLRERRFRFALEHFGAGRDSVGLIGEFPLDFIKIDGSLMQGLTSNTGIQDKVRTMVDAAKAANVASIAERVEDANTMAVLWQLGVQFLQGYFIHAPEEVTIAGAR
ncbi:MAG: EAL domain-containing protein [Steroidobacteraceae bacterium]